MRKKLICAVVLTMAANQQAAAQQTKQPPAGSATVSGVFLGRSGKPLVKARVMLSQVLADQELLYATIKPVSGVAAITDAKGAFQLNGVAPGEYTVVYQLAAGGAAPAQISARPLAASTKSTMPLLRNQEVGRGSGYAERPWGGGYTLLKDHTFWLEGPTMKIWNASLRSPQGVYVEVRRGLIWMHKLADKSQIKLDAWSQ